MKKPSVLVVDDFASMRSVVSAVLKASGFTDISQATNGKTALDRLRANGNISFVVSDWHMPEMDGLDLLKAIKSNPDMAHVQVLMITAEGQRGNVLDAMQNGAAGYIVKPFTPQTLQARLEQMFPDQ